MARRKRRNFQMRMKEQTLQLTAMVDMFTILLVFLLKSYTTSSVQLNPVDDLRVPASTAVIEPGEMLKLVVTKKGIYVDDQKILDLNDGVLDSAYIDEKDKKFIRPLYEALDAHAKKAEEIQKQNSEMKFTGAYVLQADQSLSYKMLKQVIYTSMLAGYGDLKLGAMGME